MKNNCELLKDKFGYKSKILDIEEAEESFENAKKFDTSETPKCWEEPSMRRTQNINNMQLGVINTLVDKFYSLHTMTNYRYQGFYGNGNLIPTKINVNNVYFLEHY